MLTLLSVTALASALVLSAAAIAPASAGGHGFQFHGGGHHMGHVGHIGRASHFGHLRHMGPAHHNYRRFQHLGHHHHHHHFHWRHGSYWAVGVPVAVGVAGVAAYEASGPAPVCTCLTKDYLEDGSVRFTDTCTRESAISMAPPAPIK